MKDNYTIVDEKNWERAMHCSIFRNSIEPSFCITFNLDITNFIEKIKKQGYSFTMALIFVVAKCANEIKEFRYRFVDGKVVIFDKIHTSFTYLNKENELFKVVNVDMKDTIEEYVIAAMKAAKEQKEYFTGTLEQNVFQFSSIPWISYTHISHTNSGKKDNAIPLFDWGKIFYEGDKIMVPFSVQVNHCFVDGVHVGKFASLLQEFLNTY